MLLFSWLIEYEWKFIFVKYYALDWFSNPLEWISLYTGHAILHYSEVKYQKNGGKTKMSGRIAKPELDDDYKINARKDRHINWVNPNRLLR